MPERPAGFAFNNFTPMLASRSPGCFIAALLSFGLFNLCCGAEVMTLTLDAPSSTNSYSQVITLAQGETAILTSMSQGGADNNSHSYIKLEVLMGGLTFLERPWLVSGEGHFTLNPIKVAGPATLRVFVPSSYIFPLKIWATLTSTVPIRPPMSSRQTRWSFRKTQAVNFRSSWSPALTSSPGPPPRRAPMVVAPRSGSFVPAS